MAEDSDVDDFVLEKGAVSQQFKQNLVGIRLAGLPGFIKECQDTGRRGNYSEPSCMPF